LAGAMEGAERQYFRFVQRGNGDAVVVVFLDGQHRRNKHGFP